MTLKFQKNARILTGEVIGKLTVREPLFRDSRRGVFWRCDCECGNSSYQATSCDLLSGRIKSCGCWRDSQHFADLRVKHGGRRQKKGTTSPTYSTWANMKTRCKDANNVWYGGRGITYCAEWEFYENFLRDMGEKPFGMEIDRFPDPDGNYEPNNCRWATHKENCNNQSRHKPIDTEALLKELL